MNFFGIGKAFCVQKAHKKYSLIVDCFCNQYPASCRCGEQKMPVLRCRTKTRQAIGAGFLLERNAEYRTKYFGR